MLSGSEKQIIIKSYREKNKSIRRMWKLIFLRIGLFMFAVLAIIIVLLGWKDNLELQVFTYIGGGIAITFLIISYIVGNYMYSPKATYETLFLMLIEKINFYEETSLNYQAYKKERKTINKESQLFTRGAGVTVHSSIQGYNQYLEAWSLLDIRVVISTGQSTSILFDGLVFEMDRPNKVAFQLRTSSRPSNKPIKFRKEERTNTYKLFVEEEENIPSHVESIATKLIEIQTMFHVKHLYFSALKEKTYLAIQSKYLPRKQRKLTEESVQNLYDDFVRYSKIVNMLGDGQYDFDH